MKVKNRRDFYVASIETNEPVRIPQIQEEPKKQAIPESEFVSPMMGRQANQAPLPPGVLPRGNKGLQYESFRAPGSKRHSKSELEQRYGTEYFEFNGVYTTAQVRDYLKSGVMKPIGQANQEPEPQPQANNGTIEFREEKVADDQKALNAFFSEKRPEHNLGNSVYYYPSNSKNYYSEENEMPKPQSAEEKPFVPPVVPPVAATPAPQVAPNPVPEKANAEYHYPSLNLLETGKGKNPLDNDWLQKQARIIDDTMNQFGIGGKVVGFVKGPAVTQFQISFNAGVNVKEVTRISDNLKMNLAATEIRLQIPVPGKTYGGIEVPNNIREMVVLGDLLKNEAFTNNPKKLQVALGIDIGGEYVYADIDKMPHGLIAGMTGSGKSVCINSIIVSLLYKNTPDELKLVLIDPKMVELAAYDEIPHLATPVITDTKMAAASLRWAVEEMENRFNLFKSYHVRDIYGYNDIMKSGRMPIMPNLVIIIDELADLMIVASNEVESNIQRITQKARAAGIHLIVATQRPSTDIIRGSIKNNIPVRIAFKVASAVDSITILDHGGADKLLGLGDMLYSSGISEQRLQGAFVTDGEINRVTAFLRQGQIVNYLFNEDDLKEKSQTDSNNIFNDDMFEEVAHYVVNNKVGSNNRLTQAFNIGFNRANDMLNEMEKMGIVSSTVRGKQREVLVTIEELEEILKNRQMEGI